MDQIFGIIQAYFSDNVNIYLETNYYYRICEQTFNGGLKESLDDYPASIYASYGSIDDIGFSSYQIWYKKGEYYRIGLPSVRYTMIWQIQHNKLKHQIVQHYMLNDKISITDKETFTTMF